MKKKILLSLMLVCISIFAFGALSVSAERYGDYLYYTVSNDEITITGCSIAAHTIKIPGVIDGKHVTNIGDDAFYGCRSLTNITIPDSVTSIGSKAFYNCSSLTSITIPDGVTSIGEQAFYGCSSLTSITIPDGVTSIGEKIFCDCSSLTSITIPDGVTSIGNSAFYGCSSLTSITLPNCVTSIGDYVFRYCESLTSITISDSVTSISDYAFYGCRSLTNITISDSVTSISDYAFYGCRSLTNITIPDSVTSIGKNAFGECYNLESIYITDLAAYLNCKYDNIFSNPMYHANKLYINGEIVTKVIIPDGIKKIPMYAFNGCNSLTSITIPDSVTSIGGAAFKGCSSLTSITIPNSVTSIEGSAFNDCSKLTSITIPDGITNIEYGTFYDCSSLTSVMIPDSVMSIGNSVFYNCSSLTSITIPDGVTSIGNSVFYGCSNLTSIIIPNSVTNIGEYIFSGTNLQAVYYNGDENEWNNISINSDNYVLNNVQKIFFYYVNFIDESGTESVMKIDCNSKIDISEFEKIGYTMYAYTDEMLQSEFDSTKAITENTTIYLKYILNQYNAKFIDDDGTLISEGLIDYGAIITPPESPIKERTPQYTYTFAGWDGYYDGITQTNGEMVFKAKYDATINQYTYRFLDNDGKLLKEETVDYGTTIVLPEYSPWENNAQYTYTFLGWGGYTEGMKISEDIVFKAKYNIEINKYTYKFFDENDELLKEETVDYGTVIIAPDISDKTEYYLFDFWQGYTSGMTVTKNITFKAVFKYKDYLITAEGLDEPIIVTYNSNFTIAPQKIDDYHYFIGYFTEKDGNVKQITNSNGESLNVYDVVGDLTVYPYFYKGYMNKVEMQGAASAMPGDSITYKPIFATDKDAAYFTATVKYPEYLTFNAIKGTADYVAASATKEKIKDNFKTITITCVRDNYGGNAPINTNLVPCELTLDVATDATLGSIEIGIEKVNLIGNDTYAITDITNAPLTIKPKLAERIEITGDSRIDKATKFIATVYPDYTTDKSVTWSVDNESVATISADGILTPITNGRVTVTATANDEGKISESKTVDVTAYAKITSLTSDTGVWSENFVPENYNYTIYVTKSTDTIILTPSSSGGTLKLNGTDIIIPGFPQEIDLPETETTVTFDRDNVPNMTDNVYTIKIVKYEGTKTTVSDNGKEFSIKPINIAADDTVVLALYDNGKFIKMKSEKYKGTDISFTIDKSYTNAKVMVWKSLENMKPVCDIETVK